VPVQALDTGQEAVGVPGLCMPVSGEAVAGLKLAVPGLAGFWGLTGLRSAFMRLASASGRAVRPDA
jgi:hypothetical protein